ncbi:MAG: hypothetical protein KME69_08665 [Candidatus Thiodiazotropha sp. (ex Codakia orbicularis)]|nr:hypothetical protein [Candidatus Thiodiazotropha sp. (ex Codakia orbicularis)]
MDYREACKIILEQSGFEYQLGTSVLSEEKIRSSVYDYGKFYGTSIDDIGAGQIYTGIRFPIFNDDELIFDTVEGIALILSHECDISLENKRPFNNSALLCPVIPIQIFLHVVTDSMDEDRVRTLFADIGRDRIYRLIFIPPIEDSLPFGGVIYLNQITNTDVKAITMETVGLAGTLSSYGLRIIDNKITNHLLRPKASQLSNF